MATYDITGEAVEPSLSVALMELYYSYTVNRIHAFAASEALDYGATPAPVVSEQGPVQHWS